MRKTIFEKKLLREITGLTHNIDVMAEKNPDDSYKKTPESGRLAIVVSAKRSYLKRYSIEQIEDTLQDAIMYVYERCLIDEDYHSKLSISSITMKMRELAKRQKFKQFGYTQRGTIPKKGMYLHTANIYNKDGDNIIEKMGYDNEGNLLIGN